ncbi:hypothetical protein ACLVWU_11745 [Bdellovibrio sp. HCB290]|uniref:hypothetical protein n=1 Tax=Bdellovibrio sp. HCB290 TaxID=3394356 RepID=UPI0039B44E16
MKSLKVLSALFLSSALLTTACTPNDIEVGTPDVMAKVDRPKGTKKKPIVKQNGNPNAFDFGAFSAASVMMEKQIEAIELIQVALGNTDIAKTLYTVTEEKTEKGVKHLIVKSTKDELKYSNKLGDNTSVAEKDFKAFVKVDAAGARIGSSKKTILAIIGSNIYKNNGPGGEKTRSFLNTFEVYELTVNEVPGDESVLSVNIGTEGNTAYRAGKGFQKQDFNYDSTFFIDRASLNEAQVKVVDSNMFLNLGTKQFKVKAEEFSVKIEGRCSELNGAAKISMGRGKKNDIIFGQELIKITDKDWEQKIAACGQRPTVDVMRLLVY